MPVKGLEDYFGLCEDEVEPVSAVALIASAVPTQYPLLGELTLSDELLDSINLGPSTAEPVGSVNQINCNRKLLESINLQRNSDQTAGRPKKTTKLRGNVSVNHQQLEALFDNHISVDTRTQRVYLNLLKHIVNTVLDQMAKVSEEFRDLYSGETYPGGSFFDGLKCDSTPQEFDLNVIFSLDMCHLSIENLGCDDKKKNFAIIGACGNDVSEALRSVLTPWHYCENCDMTSWVVSPLKMQQVLLRAVDRTLGLMENTIHVKGQTFRITRQVNAPITLKVKGLNNSHQFEVDLVPSMKFPLSKLSRHKRLSTHIRKLCHRYKLDFSTTSFMAISLPKADKAQFEVDFHDIERELLNKSGCKREVVMMIKYLRDQKGGTMTKLWSHLLKVRI